MPSGSGELKGGILSDDGKYKSYVVNIRPPRWKESIWIGQLETPLEAQYAANAVYHYVGRSSFHPIANFTFPSLHCIATDRVPATELTSTEMCSEYVSVIAHDGYKVERKNFKKSLTDLVKTELQSNEVRRVLQQIRDGGVAGNATDDVHPTPMEEDEEAIQLLQQIGPNIDPGNGYIPGFGMSGCGFSLESENFQLDAGQSFLREFGQEHVVSVDEGSTPAEPLSLDYCLGSSDHIELQNYRDNFVSGDLNDFLDELDNEERELWSGTIRSDWILFDPAFCDPCLTPSTDYPS